MGVIRATKEQIEEYYNSPAISQSRLKTLAFNPRLFNRPEEEQELYYEEKNHFIIGDGVDMLLTQGREAFNEKYYTSDVDKPSPVMMSIIQYVHHKVKELDYPIPSILDVPNEIKIEACNVHEYQMRWLEHTRINKVNECYTYYNSLIESDSKIVLSNEQINKIEAIVKSFKESSRTAHLFDVDFYENSNRYDIYLQLPIYFEYENVQCKALLDMAIVDKEKGVVYPYDIKTLGDYTVNFPKASNKRRYDIQAVFYEKALQAKLPEGAYSVMPFQFVVESTIDIGSPLIFRPSGQVRTIAEVGRASKYYEGVIITHEILGIYQLCELYHYYEKNGYDELKIVKEKDGKLSYDWEGNIY